MMEESAPAMAQSQGVQRAADGEIIGGCIGERRIAGNVIIAAGSRKNLTITYPVQYQRGFTCD